MRRRIRLGRSRQRRRSAIRLLREMPNFFGLLIRLMRDARVSRLDRVLFGLVMAYVLMPADLIPDIFGFLGLADDLYLIGLALNRLFSRAGPDLLLEHWEGNPRALGYVVEGVEEIGALLPRRIRETLKGFV